MSAGHDISLAEGQRLAGRHTKLFDDEIHVVDELGQLPGERDALRPVTPFGNTPSQEPTNYIDVCIDWGTSNSVYPVLPSQCCMATTCRSCKAVTKP